MSLPGTTVTLLDTPPPRSAPTDTSVWFLVGMTERGPTTATLVTSLAQHDSVYGARVSYGFVRDALEVFFREGGGQAYVNRVVGPAPVIASKNLLDASSGTCLVVKANSSGTWGNSISVAVLAGTPATNFVISILYNGVEVENSGQLADTTAAVTWGAGSNYVTITQGASVLDPAVLAAAALAGGTDDHANALDANWKTALDGFGSELGPGQVSAPGRTTDQTHIDLQAHAATHNRFALLDFVDSPSATTLLQDVTDARSTNARWSAAFGPWALVGGGPGGTVRTVPYSAIEAGMIARNEGLGLGPNVPAAGDRGQSSSAIGLSQAGFTDADRESLNNQGFNVSIVKYGGVRTYGYRSLANPASEPNYILASNMRLIMGITADAGVIAENYLFQVIDGPSPGGNIWTRFKSDLIAMLLPYFNSGQLYGLTSDQAFSVDVGPQINTPTTIAAGEIHAVLEVVMSPFGEQVKIQIVKRSVTEGVS
jgi:hypothetical protein